MCWCLSGDSLWIEGCVLFAALFCHHAPHEISMLTRLELVWMSSKCSSTGRAHAHALWLQYLTGLWDNGVCISLIFFAAAQFHKLNMVETQQVEQNHEMRQAIAKLQEKVEQHDAAIEMQPTPQLSEVALVQKLQEQENTIRILKSAINRLQTELYESEKSRRGFL